MRDAKTHRHRNDARKEEVYTHSSLNQETCQYRQGSMDRHQGHREIEGVRGECELVIWCFPQEGAGKKVSRPGTSWPELTPGSGPSGCSQVLVPALCDKGQWPRVMVP